VDQGVRPTWGYNGPMLVTRRKLAHMLTAAAAVTSTVEAFPQAAPAPSTDDDLRSARADLRSNAARIAQVKLPMSTEPAFHFKA